MSHTSSKMFKRYSFHLECVAKEDDKGPWMMVRDHADHIKSDNEFYQTQIKSLDARVEDLEEFVKDVCNAIDVSKSQMSKIPEMIRKLNTIREHEAIYHQPEPRYVQELNQAWANYCHCCGRPR